MFHGAKRRLQFKPRRHTPGVTPSSPLKRSEEHTSELQSLRHLVCRLLLEKKKKNHRHSTPLTIANTSWHTDRQSTRPQRTTPSSTGCQRQCPATSRRPRRIARLASQATTA